jgi:hypothetical protein
MKVAVLLVGYVRTWELCKSNFINTFSHLSPDVFVSTYNLQYGHHPVVQNRIGDSTDVYLADETIYQLFKDISAKVTIAKPIAREIIESLHPNFRSIIPSYGQIVNLINTLNLLADNYDIVIKTRCDLIYNSQQFYRMTNFDKLNNMIIVDSENVFPNDCIFISTQFNMRRIAEFMLNEFTTPKFSDSHQSAPHKLLYNAINDNQLHIDKQKLIHSVVRKGGIEHLYEGPNGEYIAK